MCSRRCNLAVRSGWSFIPYVRPFSSNWAIVWAALYHQRLSQSRRATLKKFHFLTMDQFGSVLSTYPVTGNNLVERIEYQVSPNEPQHGRVYINKTQYIDGVSPDVWEFHVGGYQVCHKWLKDRRGRMLSYEDVRHYQHIVAVLTETISLMERIDEAIEEYGGWPIT